MTRKTEVDIEYTELTFASDITETSWLKDINHLLPQLSGNVQPLTQTRIDKILRADTRIFVALDMASSERGRIVGVVLLCRTELLVGTKDWIEDVITDEQYQGLGIANQLMELAEQASRQSGAKHVNLTSAQSRVAARHLYTKRGYNQRDTHVFRLQL